MGEGVQRDVLWMLRISVPTATDTVLFVFRYHPETFSAKYLRLGLVMCIQYRRIVDAADSITYRGCSSAFVFLISITCEECATPF